MAQHYEVSAGETLLIRGPANIIVKTGDVPAIGSPGDNAGAAPSLTELLPSEMETGGGNAWLRAIGTGFTENSVIVIDLVDMNTTFTSDTELMTSISPVASPVTWPVHVRDGAQHSNEINLTFTDPGAGATTTKKRKGHAEESKA